MVGETVLHFDFSLRFPRRMSVMKQPDYLYHSYPEPISGTNANITGLYSSATPNYVLSTRENDTSYENKHSVRNYRNPIGNDFIREQLRADLLKGDPHLKFDGSKPEDFWFWHDQLNSKLTASGCSQYSMEALYAIRA